MKIEDLLKDITSLEKMSNEELMKHLEPWIKYCRPMNNDGTNQLELDSGAGPSKPKSITPKKVDNLGAAKAKLKALGIDWE